jgi:hypothetical protein
MIWSHQNGDVPMGETANIIGLAEIFDNGKNRLTDNSSMNVADDAPAEVGIILRLSEILLRHGQRKAKGDKSILEE